MQYDSYLNMLAARGRTKRERDVNAGKNRTKLKAMDSISTKNGVVLNGNPCSASVISTTVITQKTLITFDKEDEFNVGDKVIWNGAHWIVIKKDMEDEVYQKGVMEVCNQLLVWQNPNDGCICQEWCIIDKPYYSNLWEVNDITVSNREFYCRLPMNEDTCTLDVGKRLMPEIINGKPKTYRITTIDAMTERYIVNDEVHGIVQVNFSEDQYNPTTDRADLMICNYVDWSNRVADEEKREMVIRFSGPAVLKIGSINKTFTAVDADGNEIAGVDWTIRCEEAVKSKLKTETTGAKCRLRIENDRKLIGQKIILTAKHMDYKDEELEIGVFSQ